MKFRKPFFRKDRGLWYVQLDGRQINLGPERGPAFEQYKQLLADREKAPPKREAGSVALVCDKFLDWLGNRVEEGTKAPKTFRWYRRYLQSFVKFKTVEFAIATLSVEKLEPFHVYQWADSHPGWSTGKRGALTSVQRAFNWAAKAGHLASLGGKSPLAGLEKPRQGRREQLVTDEEYRDVLAVLTSPESRDLIELSWETGMRPNELFTAQARFFEPDNSRLVFPIRLSKGQRVHRVVYLNAAALAIVKRCCLKNPDGPFLRNTEGRPWCGESVNCVFQRVRRELGRRRLKAAGLFPPPVKRLTGTPAQRDPVKRAEQHAMVLARRKQIGKLAWEHGTKYSLYAFRHAFCTEALENGLDAVTVSVLMGHRDTTMISRVYSHVHQRHEHMKQAANRASDRRQASFPFSDN